MTVVMKFLHDYFIPSFSVDAQSTERKLQVLSVWGRWLSVYYYGSSILNPRVPLVLF